MKSIFIAIIFISIAVNTQAYSQQKINDFYLSNFKEDGTHDWEVRGVEAMVYDEYVDIEKMNAHYYLEDDTIQITSDSARLNKENMDVHLENNVNITNKEGARIITDSLDWQNSKNLIHTQDWVKATRDEMQITAQGMSADTEMQSADFKKDVEVSFPDQETKIPITANCTGPLEIEYSEGKAIFHDDVVVTHVQGKVYSDKCTLFFNTETKAIIKIVSEGNVKIFRDGSETYAEQATYFGPEDKLVLEGRPRLIYYIEEGNSSLGGL
ncbi:MAG: LPS export ABC transporter periplasmic protein LptC [Candidatus Omnitrophica bacterium]|nr:LPS export ABC transporter periplasmic protein LptC [Candidatus Omnitrophota bacterium]